MGLGTLVLLVNAALIWLYTLSCHSCRHIMGGRLKHFSKHPVRYKAWQQVSKLNATHMQLAWVSLIWLAVTDFYIFLLATGTITDLRSSRCRRHQPDRRTLQRDRARATTRYDVVVIGAGGAGLRAAIEAREAGQCARRSSASRCSARRTP